LDRCNTSDLGRVDGWSPVLNWRDREAAKTPVAPVTFVALGPLVYNAIHLAPSLHHRGMIRQVRYLEEHITEYRGGGSADNPLD
jgi:hypothetical protein